MFHLERHFIDFLPWSSLFNVGSRNQFHLMVELWRLKLGIRPTRSLLLVTIGSLTGWLCFALLEDGPELDVRWQQSGLVGMLFELIVFGNSGAPDIFDAKHLRILLYS